MGDKNKSDLSSVSESRENGTFRNIGRNVRLNTLKAEPYLQSRIIVCYNDRRPWCCSNVEWNRDYGQIGWVSLDMTTTTTTTNEVGKRETERERDNKQQITKRSYKRHRKQELLSTNIYCIFSSMRTVYTC